MSYPDDPYLDAAQAEDDWARFQRTDDPYLERIMDAEHDAAEARAIRADEEAELEAERRLSRREAGHSSAGAVGYAQHPNTNKGVSQ